MKKFLLLAIFMTAPNYAQMDIGQCERLQGRVITFLRSVNKVKDLAREQYYEALVSQSPCYHLYESKELIWESQRLIIQEGGYFIKGTQMHCSRDLATKIENSIVDLYSRIEMLEADVDEELSKPLNYCR